MEPVPEPTTKYREYSAGWLAKDGLYYPCASLTQHYVIACSLLKKFHPHVFRKIQQDLKAREDDALQERGWIRVGAMMSYNYGFVIWKHPTQSQVDAIWDYCRSLKRKMPRLEPYD